MKICEQDFDLAANLQELCDLDGGKEIGSMRPTCSGSTPVDIQRANGQDIADNVASNDLLHI